MKKKEKPIENVGYAFSEAMTLSEDGSLPKSVKLLKEGNYFYGRESMKIPHTALESMVTNFKSGVRPEKPSKLCINYNHGIGWAMSPEEGVAAGWIEDISLSDDGWLSITPTWTPRAAEYIKNKEYQYLSAEFNLEYRSKYTDGVIGPTLTGAAVTNIPFIEGQEGLTLSEHFREDEDMKELQEQFDELTVNFASLDTAKTALETEKTDLTTKLTEATEKVTVLETEKTALETEKTALSTDKTALENRIVELALDLRKKEADEVVLKAINEGGLTPGEKEEYTAAYLKDKDLTLSLLAKHPKVELGEIGIKKEIPEAWDFAAEVDKYQKEHAGTKYGDAAIAVTQIHYGGK